jgi:hypothetical protein
MKTQTWIVYGTALTLSLLAIAATPWGDKLPNVVNQERYARFANANGNPPWHYPGITWITTIISQQEARRIGIEHWLKQTESLLTTAQRQCLSNSLSEVVGFRNDSMQFAGPIVFSVGPWPQ